MAAKKKPPSFADYPAWRGKWRDRSGRWRDAHGRYTKPPRIPPSELPKKRSRAPSAEERRISKKRSDALKKAHEERRRREAQQARERRDRAVRGWETRRRNERERVRRAKKGWKTRAFRRARERAAPGLHGGNRGDWHVLRAMIENRDKRWEDFYAQAVKLGKSDKQARDEWFSPKL